MKFRLSFILATVVLMVLFAVAEVPRKMSYQGVLTDAGGAGVPNGNYNLTFSLYDAPGGGSALWSETQSTAVENGVFNVMLGEAVALDIPFDGQYWLGIAVDGGAELSPRTQLSASAYSLMARSVADSSVTTTKIADGAVTPEKLSSAISFSQPWNENGNSIYYNGSAVGIRTNNPSSTLTVQGNIDVKDVTSGTHGIRLFGGPAVGRFETYGAAGSRNVYLTWTSGDQDRGFMGIFNPNSDLRAYFQISSTDVGNMSTRGTNNNTNSFVGQLQNYPNNGFMGVYDSGGSEQAGMYVNSSGQGVVYGDVKNFRMSHPSNPSQEIWYACIEGPEAAAYVRGTVRLQNGQATVTFPEHFRAVAQAQGMTVMLTPHSAESMGLAAVDRNANGFEIRELMGGKGSYEVDWEVKSVRRGYENYEVVRAAERLSPEIEAQPYGGRDDQ